MVKDSQFKMKNIFLFSLKHLTGDIFYGKNAELCFLDHCNDFLEVYVLKEILRNGFILSW
jgi:hypothetical protein